MEAARSKKQILVLVIGFVVFCGIIVMPSPDGMTESARRMLAVVSLMAIWWFGEGTSLAATVLLPLAFFPILGSCPVSRSLQTRLTNLSFYFFADS